MLVGPRSATSARRLHCLLQKAQGLGRQLTVVVIEGESITPWCLLGELHSRMALARFALHTSGEAKMGIRHCMFFCPICAYVANNPTTFLDHIVVGHYWGRFLLGCVFSFRYTHRGGDKGAFYLAVDSTGMSALKRDLRARKLKAPSPAVGPRGKSPRTEMA